MSTDGTKPVVYMVVGGHEDDPSVDLFWSEKGAREFVEKINNTPFATHHWYAGVAKVRD